MSGIEEIISEIEEYIESCRYQPLSNSKVIVNKDELEELLDELKQTTPDEIKRYQKILNNKDAILEDARKRGEGIIAQAKEKANEIVSEHEIMQQAYAQANEVVSIASDQAQEILDKAAEDANQIRTAAIDYTDSLLENLQTTISDTVNTANASYGNLVDSMQNCMDLISSNRAELSSGKPAETAEETQEQEEEPISEAPASEENDEDLTVFSDSDNTADED